MYICDGNKSLLWLLKFVIIDYCNECGCNFFFFCILFYGINRIYCLPLRADIFPMRCLCSIPSRFVPLVSINLFSNRMLLLVVGGGGGGGGGRGLNTMEKMAL